MSDANWTDLWTGPYLLSMLESVSDSGADVSFENDVLQIRTPEFHLSVVRSGEDQIEFLSSLGHFDGIELPGDRFVHNIDIVTSRLLQEIDGIDRGV